jgi:hypothetical protein
MANGARRNWASQAVPDEYMGLWAQDPNAGQPPAVSNNDFWGSGPGGMPVDNPGFGALSNYGGALPRLPVLPTTPQQSTVSTMHGTNPGSGGLADALMNIRRNSSFGPDAFNQRHPNFYAQPPGDPNQTTQPWGGGIMKSLGGLGGLANIGLTGWGLYQQGQQIDDLRDWRAKLNERADASLAMDREKFGLVKQEYDTRSKKRQADMWKQRDPNLRTNPSDNPYMSKLLPAQEV